MKDDGVFSHRESTSRSLLEQARAGEPQAWERLLQLYQPLITYWCLRSPLGEYWSEDVVQDVFVRVSQNLHTFHHNGKTGAFRKWLRTITRRLVADRLKSR